MSTTEEQRRVPDAATTRVPLPRTPVPAGLAPLSTPHDVTSSLLAGVRASDEEREATVARLHAAVGEGRLLLSEGDDRVAAAYATTYRHELPMLLADLPESGHRVGSPRSGAPNWPEVWTSIVWRARVAAFGAAAGPPDDAQRRLAGLLVALTAVWFLLCAVLGAGLL